MFKIARIDGVRYLTTPKTMWELQARCTEDESSLYYETLLEMYHVVCKLNDLVDEVYGEFSLVFDMEGIHIKMPSGTKWTATSYNDDVLQTGYEIVHKLNGTEEH